MNIETKNVRNDEVPYEVFGWEQTDEVSVRHGKIHHKERVLARDKNMSHYDELRELENDYLSLKQQIKPSLQYDVGTAIFLFLLFIIPGILYLVIKGKMIDARNNYNVDIQFQMSAIFDKAKQLNKE